MIRAEAVLILLFCLGTAAALWIAAIEIEKAELRVRVKECEERP